MSVSGIPSPLPPYAPPSVAAAWQETEHQESPDRPPQRRHERGAPAGAETPVPAPDAAPRSESIGTLLDVRV